MPEDVMELILAKCEFLSIVRLRKVCHSIRDFIDDAQPDAKLPYLSISNFSSGSWLQYAMDETTVPIEFKNLGEIGCVVRMFGKERIFEEEDYWNLLYRDLKLILNFQNSKMRNLSFQMNSEDSEDSENFDSKMDDLRFLLKNRRTLLKTQELTIDVRNQRQLSGILRFLDPEYLKTLEIYATSPILDKLEFFEIEEIKKLEQWKKLETIHIGRYALKESILEFAGFSNVTIRVNQITVDEVMELKKILLSSSTFENLKFRYINFCGDRQTLNQLGPVNIGYVYSQGQCHRWFVQMPNPMEILELSHYEGRKTLEFWKIQFSDLHARVRMQD